MSPDDLIDRLWKLVDEFEAMEFALDPDEAAQMVRDVIEEARA